MLYRRKLCLFPSVLGKQEAQINARSLKSHEGHNLFLHGQLTLNDLSTLILKSVRRDGLREESALVQRADIVLSFRAES